jgi:hypothetical protein
MFLNAPIVEKQRDMILIDPGKVAHIRAEDFQVRHDDGRKIVLRVLVQNPYRLAPLIVWGKGRAVRHGGGNGADDCGLPCLRVSLQECDAARGNIRRQAIMPFHNLNAVKDLQIVTPYFRVIFRDEGRIIAHYTMLLFFISYIF